MIYNMEDLQEVVKEFFVKHDMSESVQARILDVMSEAGELAKEHNKITKHGQEKFEPTLDWSLEMGDVLFALMCLANLTDVNLKDALYATLEKLELRHKQFGRIGSGR